MCDLLAGRDLRWPSDPRGLHPLRGVLRTMKTVLAVLALVLATNAQAEGSQWFAIATLQDGHQLVGKKASLVVQTNHDHVLTVSGVFAIMEGTVAHKFYASIAAESCKNEGGTIVYQAGGHIETVQWSLDGTRGYDFEGAVLCGGFKQYMIKNGS